MIITEKALKAVGFQPTRLPMTYAYRKIWTTEEGKQIEYGLDLRLRNDRWILRVTGLEYYRGAELSTLEEIPEVVNGMTEFNKICLKIDSYIRNHTKK